MQSPTLAKPENLPLTISLQPIVIQPGYVTPHATHCQNSAGGGKEMDLSNRFLHSSTLYIPGKQLTSCLYLRSTASEMHQVNHVNLC